MRASVNQENAILCHAILCLLTAKPSWPTICHFCHLSSPSPPDARHPFLFLPCSVVPFPTRSAMHRLGPATASARSEIKICPVVLQEELLVCGVGVPLWD
ncbi:hypothetical protein M438DRAFT_204382 [Aureobasidium pullulans EXF-150]|uniref:Uncharacterized protein n=1 Tax=Aureobasidium pullulans EXF-150 TaxID=1043002 RepID=A0A074XHI4_AURPU|nr:uncharacterized protein M438DRAFT_204382 [Aureobasidium pullulans EXF-150]KEQ84960.1 hypothetical protein M438DRAFT_204382 [Aureobasidium pullulans EXF-150]